MKERRYFLEQLQNFAKRTSIRVSLLSGDVHCCCAGKLQAKHIDPGNDPFFMVQIVSSAIIHLPPPQMMLNLLSQHSVPIDFNSEIVEEMYDLFSVAPNGNPVSTWEG